MEKQSLEKQVAQFQKNLSLLEDRLTIMKQTGKKDPAVVSLITSLKAQEDHLLQQLVFLSKKSGKVQATITMEKIMDDCFNEKEISSFSQQRRDEVSLLLEDDMVCKDDFEHEIQNLVCCINISDNTYLAGCEDGVLIYFQDEDHHCLIQEIQQVCTCPIISLLQFEQDLFLATSMDGISYLVSKKEGLKQTLSFQEGMIMTGCLFEEMLFLASDGGDVIVLEKNNDHYEENEAYRKKGLNLQKMKAFQDDILAIDVNDALYQIDVITIKNQKELFSYPFLKGGDQTWRKK